MKKFSGSCFGDSKLVSGEEVTSPGVAAEGGELSEEGVWGEQSPGGGGVGSENEFGISDWGLGIGEQGL